MRRPILLVSAITVAAATALAGCGSSSSGGSATTPSASSSPALSGEIIVFAAASLTESFGTIGKQFEAANPGTTVTFNFGASSTLATQITQSAPADVFASASAKNMNQVVSANAAGTPTTFAKNVMEVAVPPSNPANVTSINDLAKSSVKVAVCEPAVPCGALAQQIFKNANITVKPVTEEADVKATLSKVELGEVDAGMVYVTDVKAAGDKVAGVPIPDNVNAATDYPIATITASKNPALAQAFVDYVLSTDGEAVLTAAGFQPPT